MFSIISPLHKSSLLFWPAIKDSKFIAPYRDIQEKGKNVYHREGPEGVWWELEKRGLGHWDCETQKWKKGTWTGIWVTKLSWDSTPSFMTLHIILITQCSLQIITSISPLCPSPSGYSWIVDCLLSLSQPTLPPHRPHYKTRGGRNLYRYEKARNLSVFSTIFHYHGR